MGQKLIESRFVTGPNDSLATSDVYEVTENAIRSRASGLSDDELSLLMGMLRIPFEPITEVLEPILDLISDILNWLQDRINDLLNLLPQSIKDLLGSLGGGEGSFDVIDSLLGYASLGLAWDYDGELIFINPEHADTYKAAQDAVRAARRRKGDNPNSITQAVDQGAETIVYTEFLKKLIGANLSQPIDEILGLISNDSVRQTVCENCFPNVFDPTGSNELNPSVMPGQRPDNNEGGVNNPTEKPLHRPSFEAGGDYGPGGVLQEDPSGRDNPWASGERGSSEEDGLDSSNGGVTTRPSPFHPIQWDTPPDDSYWDIFDPDNPFYGIPGFGASDDDVPGSASVGGSGASGALPGTPEGSYGGSSGTRPPGIRDNYPSWLGGEGSSGVPGFDWDMVDEIKKYVRPETIIARYPGILGMILHYYAYPGGNYTREEEYVRLTELMDWLRPDWAKGVRNGVETGRLLYFSTASTDAVHLLVTYPESMYRDEVMIAKSYRFNEIPELLKVQYPRLVI